MNDRDNLRRAPFGICRQSGTGTQSMSETEKQVEAGVDEPCRSPGARRFDAPQFQPHLETPGPPEDCPSLSIVPRQSHLVELAARMLPQSLGGAFHGALDCRVHLGKHFVKREG